MQLLDLLGLFNRLNKLQHSAQRSSRCHARYIGQPGADKISRQLRMQRHSCIRTAKSNRDSTGALVGSHLSVLSLQQLQGTQDAAAKSGLQHLPEELRKDRRLERPFPVVLLVVPQQRVQGRHLSIKGLLAAKKILVCMNLHHLLQSKKAT